VGGVCRDLAATQEVPVKYTFVRAVVLAVLVACAAPAAQVGGGDLPAPLPHDSERAFTIWLGGARIGTATERETWTPVGVHLRRIEDMRFLRGDAEVEIETTIDVDADVALVARRVTWTETAAGATREATATREADGWHVSTGARLPAQAVPSELVPLIVRRDGRFAGTAFLPARGFVTGSGRIDPVAPGRLVARVQLAGGPAVEATIDLDGDGAPARVVDGEGVIEMRASSVQARAPFPAVDLIGATALAISGPHRTRRMLLEGDLALPPVPGQTAHPAASGVEVELGRQLPGDLPAGTAGPDRRAEIAALVAAVRGRITPDLGAPHASDPLQATSGDCTTFALAYAALAQRRGIATRVVTGLRVDGARLVRHRWAVSWTGRAWIAVDAAFGAAPAGGDLVALAVHDADDAGLVSGEAALVRVRAASWVY
jgi:hypothetical protein